MFTLNNIFIISWIQTCGDSFKVLSSYCLWVRENSHLLCLGQRVFNAHLITGFKTPGSRVWGRGGRWRGTGIFSWVCTLQTDSLDCPNASRTRLIWGAFVCQIRWKPFRWNPFTGLCCRRPHWSYGKGRNWTEQRYEVSLSVCTGFGQKRIFIALTYTAQWNVSTEPSFTASLKVASSSYSEPRHAPRELRAFQTFISAGMCSMWLWIKKEQGQYLKASHTPFCFCTKPKCSF